MQGRVVRGYREELAALVVNHRGGKVVRSDRCGGSGAPNADRDVGAPRSVDVERDIGEMEVNSIARSRKGVGAGQERNREVAPGPWRGATAEYAAAARLCLHLAAGEISLR